MTLRVFAKSSEQKPWYNLNIKISTLDRRRGLEHSIVFHMSPKSTTADGVQCSTFVILKLHSVTCSNEKV